MLQNLGPDGLRTDGVRPLALRTSLVVLVSEDLIFQSLSMHERLSSTPPSPICDQNLVSDQPGVPLRRGQAFMHMYAWDMVH